MQEMWQQCKSYFGDGFVSSSNPLRFDVHVCDIVRPLAKNERHHYGVELDEDAFPLFTLMGETNQPPCTCHDIPALISHIEASLATLPATHSGDYSLHTGKGDTSSEKACIYALRDSLSWWTHWHGSLEIKDRWKHVYIAFITVPDDVQIPPHHIVDGTWRFLGHSLAEILDGLCSEGMHADDVKLAEMVLLRQYILQYLEKVDPGLRALVVGKTTLMTKFRTLTANAHGAAICLLAARGVQSRGVSDEAVEASAIADVLGLDVAKEVMGILQGEKTETVAGDRQLLKQKLCWVYARLMIHLDAQPDGHLLRRFASSGLHFVPMMDRYLERVNMVRWPLTPAMRRLITSYVKGDVVARTEM